mmetsp:Transcript_7812/g.19532  ORF Transcript_7812/g.19532 Transcript_7812/m.19532 type:complete len:946 (-) Transcript_7812:1215-4052(-)
MAGRPDFLRQARALFGEQSPRAPRSSSLHSTDRSGGHATYPNRRLSNPLQSSERWDEASLSASTPNRRLSNPIQTPDRVGADAPFSFLPRRTSNLTQSSERWAGNVGAFSAAPSAPPAPPRRGPVTSASSLRDAGGELADLLKGGRDLRTTLGMHIALTPGVDGVQHVQSVIPGGPAHLSGMIMRGDKVTHVDGVQVDERSIASHVRGVDAVGWPCVLTLRRGDSSFNVKLHRVSVEWQEDMRGLFERLDELEVRVRSLAGSGPALDALQGTVMHVIDVERRRTASEARLAHSLAEVQAGAIGRLAQLGEERDALERMVSKAARAAAGADREREARALSERVYELEGALLRAAAEREEAVFKLREERDALSRGLENASREAEQLRTRVGGITNVLLVEAGFSGIEAVQQLGVAMKGPPETSVGEVVDLLRTLKDDPAFHASQVAKMLHDLRENTTIGPSNVLGKLLELEGLVLRQYHELQEQQTLRSEGQKALEEAQEAARALTERKERAEQGVGALSEELSMLREAQVSWSARLSESEGRAAEAEAQLHQAKEELSQALRGREQEVAVLQDKLSDVVKKIDVLRVDFVNKVADNEDLRRELDCAREELGVCKQSMGLSGEHAQQEIAEMKVKMLELQERLEEAVKASNEAKLRLQAAFEDKEAALGALSSQEGAHQSALTAAHEGARQAAVAAAEEAKLSMEEGRKREEGLIELLEASSAREEKARQELQESQERERAAHKEDAREDVSKDGRDGGAESLQEELREANKRAELSAKKEAIARKAMTQVMVERDKLSSRVDSLLSQVERDRERCFNMAAQLAAAEKGTSNSREPHKLGELASEMAALRDELDGLLQHLSEISSQDPSVLDDLLGVMKGTPAFTCPDVTEMLKSMRECGSMPSDVILLLNVLMKAKPSRSLEDVCCILAAYNQLATVEGGTVAQYR